MIKCLLIGRESDIEKYSPVLSRSKYFSLVKQHLIIDDSKCLPDFESIELFDALILSAQLKDPFPFFSSCIRDSKNLFFIDQPELLSSDIAKLEQLNNESGCLIFPEFRELNHPLVEDFIAIEPSQLQYRFTKSVAGRKDIRPSLFTALGFRSLLSSMPVKKIDVSTIETNSSARPSIKVRLKMYDSSVCHILLDIDNKNEKVIEIHSSKGKFIFNLAGNYLENVFGSKFYAEEVTSELLLERTLNSFAMNIILNSKPLFSFHHYLSVIGLIHKIDNILKNSF
jgi:hypothetical protein